MVSVTSNVVFRPCPGLTETFAGALIDTAPLSTSFWNRNVGVTV